MPTHPVRSAGWRGVAVVGLSSSRGISHCAVCIESTGLGIFLGVRAELCKDDSPSEPKFDVAELGLLPDPSERRCDPRALAGRGLTSPADRTLRSALSSADANETESMKARRELQSCYRWWYLCTDPVIENDSHGAHWNVQL